MVTTSWQVKTAQQDYRKQDIMIKWLALLILIWEVPGS